MFILKYRLLRTDTKRARHRDTCTSKTKTNFNTCMSHYYFLFSINQYEYQNIYTN